MALELAQFLAARYVPQPYRPAGQAVGQQPAVWRDGHIPNREKEEIKVDKSGERGGSDYINQRDVQGGSGSVAAALLSRDCLIQARSVIVIVHGERLPVRRKRQGADRVALW